jgi:hypothetical protein
VALQSSEATKDEQGEVVVTFTEDGRIVAVTRQDEEGRILSVIAEARDSTDREVPVAYAVHNVDLRGQVRVSAVKPWAGEESLSDDDGWGDRWAGNEPLAYARNRLNNKGGY